MTRTLSISETGLRLIKAFEGFRPTDRELVTGARVIGYGHRLYSDMPMRMSKDEAEERLKLDLESYEDLINSEVHAPLSQSQFDALVSLAFNIGPKAFRESETVRAINNGRVLDAADGFDVWRKAKIGDEIYVVDALMRRRTAEKALFLRTESALPAPGAMLDPKPDPDAPTGPSDDDLPTFSRPDNDGLVSKAAYDVEDVEEADFDDAVTDESTAEFDAPLILSNVIENENVDEIEAEVFDDFEAEDVELVEIGEIETAETVDLDENVVSGLLDEPDLLDEIKPDVEDIEDVNDTLADVIEEVVEPSPIAEAADALSERLNNLVDSDDPADVTENWPDSLVNSEVSTSEVGETQPEQDTSEETETTRSNLLAFPGKRLEQDTPVIAGAEDASETAVNPKRDEAGRPLVIDNLAADDAMRAGMDQAESSILDPEGDAERNAELYLNRNGTKKKSGGGLWIPLVIGSLLLGASLALLGRGAAALLNGWGPIAVVAAAITGGLMLLFALYAAARGRFA